MNLLSSLAIKTSLSKIALVGPLLFKRFYQVNTGYKINEIVNKFFQAGDTFTLEMHWRQLGSLCSACGPFTKKQR